MTHRQARRKLGTRTTRRSGTNGKFIKGTAGGGKKRTPAYRNPRRPSGKVANAVARLVRESA